MTLLAQDRRSVVQLLLLLVVTTMIWCWPSVERMVITPSALSINEATPEEIQVLPNIGPRKAAIIYQYRLEHGPFSNERELLNIPGMGEKSLQQIQQYLHIGNTGSTR